MQFNAPVGRPTHQPRNILVLAELILNWRRLLHALQPRDGPERDFERSKGFDKSEQRGISNKHHVQRNPNRRAVHVALEFDSQSHRRDSYAGNDQVKYEVEPPLQAQHYVECALRII